MDAGEKANSGGYIHEAVDNHHGPVFASRDLRIRDAKPGRQGQGQAETGAEGRTTETGPTRSRARPFTARPGAAGSRSLAAAGSESHTAAGARPAESRSHSYSARSCSARSRSAG